MKKVLIHAKSAQPLFQKFSLDCASGPRLALLVVVAQSQIHTVHYIIPTAHQLIHFLHSLAVFHAFIGVFHAFIGVLKMMNACIHHFMLWW